MMLHVGAWLIVEPYRYTLALVLRGDRLLPFVVFFRINQVESLPDLVAMLWLGCTPILGALAFASAFVALKFANRSRA